MLYKQLGKGSAVKTYLQNNWPQNVSTSFIYSMSINNRKCFERKLSPCPIPTHVVTLSSQ